MNRSRQLAQGKAAFDVIEAASHLLRTAPAGVLGGYYVGSLPFVLGLLYFWSDMSRGAFAGQRLASGALVMTLLFAWMKVWHTVFARQLLAGLCREPAPVWTLRRVARAATTQVMLQPSGLFLLPVGLAVLAPFGWLYAFYQNVTVLGSGGQGEDLKSVFRRSWQQALLWPAQNHSLLLLLQMFALLVFLNWMSAALLAPLLLDHLLGVETAFSRSPGTMLNSTFFAAMAGLTYLAVDPIAKATYVLRCFQGESLRTGEDLTAELKGLGAEGRLAAVAVLACLLLPAPAEAAPVQAGKSAGDAPSTVALETSSPKPGAKGAVAAAELDRAIEQVLQKREYLWRMPREQAPRAEKRGWLGLFLEGIGETLGEWARSVGRWLGRVVQWFQKYLRPPTVSGEPGPGWASAIRGLLLVLLAALAGLLGVLLVRLWRQARGGVSTQVRAEARPAPDVADESVGAEQLPEEGWLRLARELAGRGDRRLALRALYLASLAHLGERQLITPARYKSNRDYERELLRRSHALPDLHQTFAQNVSVFDRVWYGLHEVNDELLRRFAGNVERITAT